MDALFLSPLWEKHVIQHQVKVVDGLDRVLPPQHVKSQIDAWHSIQVDDGPFEAKTSHVVEVVGSNNHLPFNNMKAVSSIPPPLNEALH